MSTYVKTYAIHLKTLHFLSVTLQSIAVVDVEELELCVILLSSFGCGPSGVRLIAGL